jgi:hypothetical protein
MVLEMMKLLTGGPGGQLVFGSSLLPFVPRLKAVTERGELLRLLNALLALGCFLDTVKKSHRAALQVLKLAESAAPALTQLAAGKVDWSQAKKLVQKQQSINATHPAAGMGTKVKQLSVGLGGRKP